MGTRVMKAAVCRRPTSIGALTITDTEVPTVREDSLLVTVRASSANPVDRYAVTRVAEALGYLDEGHSMGKVAIAIGA